MEVRIESMICVWDDKIPALFLEFVNLLTLTTSEGELRKSVKEFAEKHELDKFFLYGFGSHHFYLHQRYTSYRFNIEVHPPSILSATLQEWRGGGQLSQSIQQYKK